MFSPPRPTQAKELNMQKLAMKQIYRITYLASKHVY